ncbi:MAG: type II toxin-antitoxin system HipA family toxin [Opitutae bacterium]|nr:type II toxin-antitoxin system HipA family toxin [Opitutae bacterium]
MEVHIEWAGATHLVGHLHESARSAAVSFVYAPAWLGRADAFAIDPTSMPLVAGPLHSPALFGGIQDCGPDRWGRGLIERAVRKGVLDRKPYQDLDYLLALADTSRIGALRFRRSADGPFLAAGPTPVPPLVRLAALLRATDAIHGETETAADLRFLLGEGSPLGGARPKASVGLADGRLALAKFPKRDDIRDIAAGEILALALAREAGLTVADHQLVKAGRRNVSVITRFDREGGRRIPFLSGSSLIGLAPGTVGAYTLLADGIRQHGHNIAVDLRELWGRLIFSLLASNYDDHLRNHGFLMRAPGRWSLSPAYDLNPVPEIERSQTPKTAITEDPGEPTIAAALDAAPRFGMKLADARKDLRRIHRVVSNWRALGKRLRLDAKTLAPYATAFEHALADEAGRLA